MEGMMVNATQNGENGVAYASVKEIEDKENRPPAGSDEEKFEDAMKMGEFKTYNTRLGRLWTKEISRNDELKKYSAAGRCYDLQRKIKLSTLGDGISNKGPRWGKL